MTSPERSLLVDCLELDYNSYFGCRNEHKGKGRSKTKLEMSLTGTLNDEEERTTEQRSS
jgi:hypothetical protein